MSLVALQPAGDVDANQHYEDTIVNPVSIEKIRPYVSEQIVQHLNELYPSKRIPTWGVTPGNKGVNIGKWERLQSGDLTLFARKGRVYASGVVSLKIRNSALSQALWGNKQGTTDT
ncbi:MAG TPA: hypothetical protein VFN31_02230, partial [Candidatus Saccharimonadales bacterium]|nr:hypothetical protein [Candidatus Saccharimonadales bacterium]